MNTKRLSDTMSLWFVTAVQDADKLEVMPRTQEMRLKWDNFSDPQRRMRFIEEVRWILSFFSTIIFPRIKVNFVTFYLWNYSSIDRKFF